jgi:hypothetical protein
MLSAALWSPYVKYIFQNQCLAVGAQRAVPLIQNPVHRNFKDFVKVSS